MRRSLIGGVQVDELCAMARGTPPGAVVELGVYRGGSAEQLAEVCRSQGRALWLFDSFAGIVERTDGLDFHQIGDFGGASLEEVRELIPDAKIVVGDIRETLPATDTGPVAFAHVDVDQYETHRVAIGELIPRMVRGGVIWFDDYAGLDGATRAVDDAFGPAVQRHVCGKHFVRF